MSRPERNRSRPFSRRSCVSRKRGSSWLLLLGKKWSSICAVPIASMSLPYGRSRLLGRQDTERLTRAHRKECPYCPMDCVCDFQCARRRQGRRSAEELRFANRNWIQGDDLNRDFVNSREWRRRRGIKWRWWSKVFTTWDAGVSDGGRLLR